MSIQDKAREAELKLSRDIRDSLESLQSNVIGLAHNIKAVGTDKLHDATGYVQDRVEDVKTFGSDTLYKTERRIKAKPGQSVAMAFAAGLLVSFLLGRKS